MKNRLSPECNEQEDYNEPLMSLSKRPRRLRQRAAMRDLVRENFVRVEDFVAPLFVIDGNGADEEIASMPGIKRFTLKSLVRECEELVKCGIRSVVLFPKLDSSLKNHTADEALNPETLILRAVCEVKKHFPQLLVMTDIALDPYTIHGHDGVLNDRGTDVDNDTSVGILCAMALLHAEAGVDFVAPSDMMDGRIGAIREFLDDHGLVETGIMAYTAKYNSAFYGPFRDAVGSAQAAGTNTLDKRTYQLETANRRQAFIEAQEDEAEGADILMVKPALSYLDIIRDLRERSNLPIAAYQVSGEYSQIQAAAKLGWLDLKKVRDETLLSMKRAGADIIFSYFAKEVAMELVRG